jgi:ureidoglycolate lyase
MTTIKTSPLTRDAFAPFGQVVDMTAVSPVAMNDGRAERFSDVARLELAGPNPRPLVSLARSQPVALPYSLTFVERHPFGSQMFFPLGGPFLVIVAPDEDGRPGTPVAFITAAGQGINYACNVWHGALTPLGEVSEFLILDRGGDGENLVVHRFTQPYTVLAG